MTTFTTNFLWPVPSGTDQPDGAAQFSALATPIDSVVFAGIPYLARQTLGGSAASVTFSSIPASLRSLRIRWSSRGDSAVNTQYVFLQINGSSAAQYSYAFEQNTNTGLAAGATAGDTKGLVGVMVGASATAGVYATGVVDIIGWDSPHASSLGWAQTSCALGTGIANFTSTSGGGAFTVTGPYTSLTLLPQTGNFVSGSDFQIEGVRT